MKMTKKKFCLWFFIMIVLLIFGMFGVAKYADGLLHRERNEVKDFQPITNSTYSISYAIPKSRKKLQVAIARKDAVKVYDDTFKTVACRLNPWIVEDNTNESWKIVRLNKRLQFKEVYTNRVSFGTVVPGDNTSIPTKDDGKFSILLGVFVNDSTWRMVELRAYPLLNPKNGSITVMMDRPYILKHLLFGSTLSYMDKPYLDGNVFRANLMYEGKTISDSVYSENAKKIFETILEDELFEDGITQ